MINPLNQYPLWKFAIVLFVLIMGVFYALPNSFPDDPAVQVTGADAGIVVDASVLEKAKAALVAGGVELKSAEQQERAILIRLNSSEDQLKAKDIIQKAIGDDYLAALNLAATTPEWLSAIGAGPMKLGLDLRGGVHFLMEVDMEQALEQRYKAYEDEFATSLRENKLRYRMVAYEPEQKRLALSFRDSEVRTKSKEVLGDQVRDFVVTEQDDGDLFYLYLTLTELKLKEITDYAISQNVTTLRNRVNELGVAEPLVQRQGLNRIVVELPGVQDTASAKRVLGRTASLEFRMVDWENSVESALRGRLPRGSELFYFKDESKGAYLLKRSLIVKGDNVLGAQSGFDENGQPQVSIDLDGVGGKKMLRTTMKHVGDSMAVLFVENKIKLLEDGSKQKTVQKYLINVATIQSSFGNRFRITGLDSPAESSELALLLRAGALAAPMYFVEERTVGPSLGQENIDAGVTSIAVGFMLVLVFMVIYYRVFGIFANIALVGNLVVLVAVMSMIPGATLTLPGIAGIVLTVGMAVDANVLIFERIKEELARGLSPHPAISAGYDRAFTTILDANITTLIVAVILFAAGTGPVKGFAVTLSIGIMTSMFTAIMGTRALVSLVYGGRRVEKVSI